MNSIRLFDAAKDFVILLSVNWSNNTRQNYQSTFDALQRYYSRNIFVSGADPRDLHKLVYYDDWYRRKNGASVRPRTKAKRWDHLHHFFRWAVGEDYLAVNPMDRVQKVVVDDEIPPIPDESEYKEFVRRCPYPFNFFVALLGSMGPRAGELFWNGKSWMASRYDGSGAIIFNKTKTHKARKIPLPENEKLRTFVLSHVSAIGEINFMVSTADIYHIVKAIWKGMGKPFFCVKTFRTFAINMMLSESGQSWFVANAVGNTERTIRKHYGHAQWKQFIPLVNLIDFRDAGLQILN